MLILSQFKMLKLFGNFTETIYKLIFGNLTINKLKNPQSDFDCISITQFVLIPEYIVLNRIIRDFQKFIS